MTAEDLADLRDTLRVILGLVLFVLLTLAYAAAQRDDPDPVRQTCVEVAADSGRGLPECGTRT